MAIDLTKLTQTELLQLVNAAGLGQVLTRSILRRQMDAAALSIGDGTRIHLGRYARWLLAQYEAPQQPRVDYAEARKRQAERNRAATKASQDVSPIPEVEDIQRRLRCAESFRRFCETYFPAAFHRAWSDDHLRVIGKIEKAVREGGLFAFAMPRGSGKTTLARCAAMWAVLYGYRPFVCLIGAADDRAKELLLPIKKHILENPLLLADFPEAIHPLRALENSSKRQLQQHCRGQLTHVNWGQSKLVFPTIENDDLPAALRRADGSLSLSAGSIIATTSLDANIRGQQHTRVDGSIIRPSLVLLDDPQTRESARSVDQTRKRLELLNGDVLGMAGPGEQISALITCTKMYEGDLADVMLNREASPEWESECTRLVYEFPTNLKLWDEYFEVRRTKGKAAAAAFYVERQAAMDAGAVIAWPDRYDAKNGEISAVQHAMHLRHKVGIEAFKAEYQNEPSVQQTSDRVLTVDQVMEKINGYPRGEVPPACTRLTMFVDVHNEVLYYVVCGWEETFTGYVLDYGTFPDQRRVAFTLADATHTLGKEFPGTGTGGAIYAGLQRLVSAYMSKDWTRGAGRMRLDRLLVDMGYKPGIVADVQVRIGGNTMLLSKGVGIRASRKPIAEYARKPGDVLGHHWYIPNMRRTGQFPHVLIDVNYWKSFVHEGLATAAGDPGSISIFGKDGKAHALIAEHIARSEKWVEVVGPGGVVREWSALPTRTDNHWLDCLVGCAAAASVVGVRMPGDDVPRGKKRSKIGQRLRLSERQRSSE